MLRLRVLALGLGVAACSMSGGPTSMPAWSMPPEDELVDASRRWPARVPTIEGVSSVGHFRLRHGGAVLFFRPSGSLDEATAAVLQALQGEGWPLLDHHGAGPVRALSGCAPDCDRERFYLVIRQELVGRVHAILRMIGPDELAEQVELPDGCEVVALAEDLSLHRGGGVQPVRDVDLDRDGRLDAFVPRRGDDVLPGETEPQIVWDALVMRDGCGHRVGTFTEVPYDDHFAPVGPHGLIDLTVRSRKAKDGEVVRELELMRFTGERYAPAGDGR